MMQKLLLYFGSFLLLLIMQEYILLPLSQSNYFVLLLYPMVLITMDIQTPPWMVMGFALFCGVVADVTDAGGGIFTASMLPIALVRMPLMKSVFGRDLVYKGGAVSSSRVESANFMFFTFLCMLLWYGVFYSLHELGAYSWLTPVRMLVSTVISTVIIFFLQLPFNQQSKS